MDADHERPQRLVILGSTGSIGASTLDVVARHPQKFRIVGLSAHQRIDELIAQCLRWRPVSAVVPDEDKARRLREALRTHGVATQVRSGAEALCDMAADPDVDSVMAAIVGAAGLRPCLAAARAGKRLLLANKEALVVGGALFMSAVKEGGAALLPIDSEHSAIFQCLPQQRSQWPDTIEHIVLTASGGPFRTRDPATLHAVTPDEAIAHPNWVMGRKISVDSATMMNKALEVIEARWLFDLEPEQIRVVIHPQSIIHSMVVCRDGSVLAQLGTPDMRGPISYAQPDGALRRRPSFAALATLERELAGSLCHGPQPAPAGTRLYRFTRPAGGELWAGWSLAGARRAALPAAPLRAAGRGGEPLALAAGAEVELLPAVRYFELPAARG